MRAFVGVPLDHAQVEALVAAGQTVRAEDPVWREAKWVPPENLHITLQFLGDIQPDMVQALVTELSSRLSRLERAGVSFGAVEARPRAQRARMIWAEYDDSVGVLARAAGSVSDAAASLGIVTEDRPFVAHATMVRARRPAPIDPESMALATQSAQSALGENRVMSVLQAILYKSTLTRAGAVYETLAEIPIGEPR